MVPEVPKEDRIYEENTGFQAAGSEQNFDEVPVGKTGGSTFNISEYPEGIF